MHLPLRDIEIFGMLLDPAVILLALCAGVFFPLRYLLDQLVDLNRFIWRRPLFDLALFCILYSVGILTLQPI